MHPPGRYLRYLILVFGLLVGLLILMQLSDEQPVAPDRPSAAEALVEIKIDETGVCAVEQTSSARPQCDVVRGAASHHAADVPRHLSFADTRPLRHGVQVPEPKISVSKVPWMHLPERGVSGVSPEVRPAVSAASTTLRSVVLLI